MQNKTGERRFWNFLLNFAPVKWTINRKISQKIANSKVGSKFFNHEMVTYIFFGVVTTAINWGTFFGLCLIMGVPINDPTEQYHLQVQTANAVAFVVALLFAFITNKIIVFNSRSMKPRLVLTELAQFTVARLGTFGMEQVMNAIATQIGFSLFVTRIIASFLIIALNYIFSKWYIFKNKKDGENASSE